MQVYGGGYYRRGIRLFFLAVVLVHLAGIPAVYAQQGMTPLVTVTSVAIQDVNPPDEYVGHVEALQSVELMARVQGFLEKVCFDEGSDVAAGDLLYVIEQAPYKTAVNADKAAVAQAEAASLKAAQYLKRVREVGSGGVSATDIETAEAEALRAEAQLQGAQAALEQSELNLSYTRVMAPISGRIGRSAYTKGNLVGPSSGALARIVQLNPVRVVFSISENDLATMDGAGGTDRSRQIRLRFANGDLCQSTGRIDFMDNRVNSDTGTIAVRALFDNAGGKLLPGQYVTVLISSRAPVMKPVVPQASVVEDRQGKYVLLVDEAGVASQQRITTGVMIDGYWSIEAGLSGGETVIVDGIQKVQPGAAVKAKPVDGQ
jgi:membrane fusion protein (multidrug efflux system)